MTTLSIFPKRPKYSFFFKTSTSASRCDKPTTNTRFFCTTRTSARCRRFSLERCFFWCSFCLRSFFIRMILKKTRWLGAGWVKKRCLGLTRLRIRARSELDCPSRACDTQDTGRSRPSSVCASRIDKSERSIRDKHYNVLKTVSYLVATRAWVKVGVVDFQWFHTKWTLKKLAIGHFISLN